MWAKINIHIALGVILVALRPQWTICMMTSFYYYDQNPSGVVFL